MHVGAGVSGHDAGSQALSEAIDRSGCRHRARHARRRHAWHNTHVPKPPGTPGEHDDDEANPFAGQAKFSLTQAMSSMLALGLTLEQVVPMVDEQCSPP